MGKAIRWLAAFVFVIVPAACGSDSEDPATGAVGPSVVASTSIIEALTREVAGGSAVVTSLTGPGSDPHLFEPSPDDIRAVSDADLVLLNGLNLDDHLRDDIEAAHPDVPVIIVTDGIDLIHTEHDEPDESDEGDGEEHEHGDIDPHVWQDPLRVKTMVDNIAAALSTSDPDNAGAYRDASERYKRTLDETHEQIQALIGEIPPENRKIVTNHEAFGYFAARYELEVVGTVFPGLSTEADPSASEIATLIDLIEAQNVRAIFAERIANSAVAEQIAADTGVQVVTGLYTDQVGEESSGAETVHGMLLANAVAISEALK